MGRKRSHEEATQIAAQQGFRLAEPYKGTDFHHKFECIKRGHTSVKRFSSVVNGKGCRECDLERQRLPHDEAVKEANKAGHDLLETYRNTNYKHRVRCQSCGWVYRKAFYSLIAGCGCPNCYRLNHVPHNRLTDNTARALTASRGHTLLEPYRGANSKHRVRCNDCDYEYSKLLSAMWAGNGCPRCAGQVVTRKEAAARTTDAGHTLLEPYRGAHYKHHMRCNSCGGEYRKNPSDLWAGYGCSRCGAGLFDYCAPAVVYLIWISDFDVKYGVTNLGAGLDPRDGRRVPRLERSLPGKLCDWWRFDTGQEAYEVEQRVGRFYLNHRPQNPADGDGYTERVKGVYFDQVRQTIGLVPAASRTTPVAASQPL